MGACSSTLTDIPVTVPPEGAEPGEISVTVPPAGADAGVSPVIGEEVLDLDDDDDSLVEFADLTCDCDVWNCDCVKNPNILSEVETTMKGLGYKLVDDRRNNSVRHRVVRVK